MFDTHVGVSRKYLAYRALTNRLAAGRPADRTLFQSRRSSNLTDDGDQLHVNHAGVTVIVCTAPVSRLQARAVPDARAAYRLP